MKRLTTILMVLSTIGCGTHGSPSDAASQVTMASLLDEMISYDAVTGYPAVNYRAAQVPLPLMNPAGSPTTTEPDSNGSTRFAAVSKRCSSMKRGPGP